MGNPSYGVVTNNDENNEERSWTKVDTSVPELKEIDLNPHFIADPEFTGLDEALAIEKVRCLDDRYCIDSEWELFYNGEWHDEGPSNYANIMVENGNGTPLLEHLAQNNLI